MRKILGLTIALAAALLAGCGGSTLYGDPPADPTAPIPAQTMTILTSTPQIPSDGSTGAIITAVVRGAQNQFLPDVPINFTATSGGISTASALTDQNGAATTVLTAAGDPVNRTITVTASNGPVTLSINIDVTGSQLTMSGPSSLVLGGSPGAYVATLVDSGGRGLIGRPVTLASSNGGTITPSANLTTNANGQVTFNVAATASGAGTLTANALGLTAVVAVNVSSDSFAITAPPANSNINLGQVVNVSATWSSGGAPVNGQSVSFATTRGTLSASSAITAGGVATVSLSSMNAGPANITATTSSGIQVQLPVNFIATTATSLTLQPSPSNVPINTQSTITAIVRDANNNLVQGQRVNFNLTDVTGGSLSTASSTTDALGRAQTIYTASGSTSASNGVVVNAALENFPAVTGQTSLTVGGRSVFVSLGTGNSILEPNITQYTIEYAAQAIDAAGNGLDGIPISFTLHALDFRKGYRYAPCILSTLDCGWATQVTAFCPSEDLGNLNGQLDPGEDLNNDGRLTPGDIATVAPGTATTSNGGTAIVRITYPQDHAYYARVRLIATAVVQGTQTSSAASFILQGAENDFDNELDNPPGPESPFGIGATCADDL